MLDIRLIHGLLLLYSIVGICLSIVWYKTEALDFDEDLSWLFSHRAIENIAIIYIVVSWPLVIGKRLTVWYLGRRIRRFVKRALDKDPENKELQRAYELSKKL